MESATKLLGRTDALFIGGRWRQASDANRVSINSPATGELVGETLLARPVELARAVKEARTAFDSGPWPHLSASERAEFLRRLAGKLGTREHEFARVLALEVGSPVSGLPQAQMCADLLLDHVRLASEYPWTEERQGLEANLEVRRAPVGVVAAIVPWNVPLFLAMTKLAPALLAGCTVVLKPASETPLHSVLLAEVLGELDLPDGVVSVVPADRTVGELLVRDPGIDKVSFTGSTEVGRKIGAICAQGLKRCSLELGGKSAALVLRDARLEDVVSELAPATMVNSGQMCANQTRVLIDRAIYPEALEALVEAVAGFTLGDPLDPETDIGPLVSEQQRERVERYVRRGQKEGGRVVLGGGRRKDLEPGFFFEPTILADVDNAMRVAREEIFGPVVTVIAVDGEDEAVRLANDSSYGLSGTVWSSDDSHALEVARQLRTGHVGVNTFLLDLTAPFGGFKDSGIGRECGPEGIEAFVEPQSIERARGGPS